MKVGEMIAYLSEFDPELELIQGSDEEGNSFSSPYAPSLSWVYEDGYEQYPVHDDDVDTEYDRDDLVQKVVL